MATKVGICNLALSHLGVGKEIASLTEQSEEASVCNRFFDQVKEELFREIPWSFAIKFADMELVEEDPTDEWGFSYRYPSDCVKFIRILSGLRNDNRQSRVPYKMGADGSGKLIYSDIDSAQCEYICLADDPQFWPSDFVQAFAFKLAFYIAPRVTGGDPYKLGQRAFEGYKMAMAMAASSNFNEQQVEEDPESDFIRARE